jgi:clan AA aspartic protease (TIGR02281 family)
MTTKILNFVFLMLVLGMFNSTFGQTTITMQKKNGVYYVPCKANGLSLEFIFDTGAGDVSISLTEALFMHKQGYLKNNDFVGTEYYRIANGEIQEGTKIIIKVLEFAGLKLYNVEASVVHTLSAPLLLGQSVISKLGKIQLDGNKLTIFKGTNANYNYGSSSNYNQNSSSAKNDVNQESPCLNISGNIKYSTKIISGTLLRDEPSTVTGKQLKILTTGTEINIINDTQLGEFALASFNGCNGYVLKIALEKFH